MATSEFLDFAAEADAIFAACGGGGAPPRSMTPREVEDHLDDLAAVEEPASSVESPALEQTVASHPGKRRRGGHAHAPAAHEGPRVPAPVPIGSKWSAPRTPPKSAPPRGRGPLVVPCGGQVAAPADPRRPQIIGKAPARIPPWRRDFSPSRLPPPPKARGEPAAPAQLPRPPLPDPPPAPPVQSAPAPLPFPASPPPVGPQQQPWLTLQQGQPMMAWPQPPTLQQAPPRQQQHLQQLQQQQQQQQQAIATQIVLLRAQQLFLESRLTTTVAVPSAPPAAASPGET